PMHAFTALPQPLRWYLGRRARQLNVALAQLVNGRMDCVLQASELPLHGEALAADGFHPGATSYALWAEGTANTMREYFSDPVSLGGRLVKTPAL
ncbi:MAG: hypothetical protein AAGC84_07845, partial [Pseudomonas sp.]